MVAYVILSRERVRDTDTLAAYTAGVLATFHGHAVTPRIVFGRQEVREGPAVDGIAMLEFPTFDEARAWYDSPAYQEAAQYRFRAADFRCVIVEGLP